MKKKFWLIAAMAAVCFSSCADFETSGNGSFDGFWQLTNVDTLATGKSGDVRNRMIFWSVQANLIELNDLHTDPALGARKESVYFRFELTSDSLKLLAEPKPIINNRRISDRLAERSDVSIYGLNELNESFRVLRLDDEKMSLQSERLRMHFRKY